MLRYFIEMAYLEANDYLVKTGGELGSKTKRSNP